MNITLVKKQQFLMIFTVLLALGLSVSAYAAEKVSENHQQQAQQVRDYLGVKSYPLKENNTGDNQICYIANKQPLSEEEKKQQLVRRMLGVSSIQLNQKHIKLAKVDCVTSAKASETTKTGTNLNQRSTQAIVQDFLGVY